MVTFVVVGIIILLALVVFLALRKKQTVKLTADEYNLLMRRKFDMYELRSFLVRGDFNTTFEAFDPDRKSIVALRILDHNKIYHDQIVHQFNLKGEMLKFLAERYPGDHFVQGIKFGTVKIEEEPRPYIVSEYVQGASLSDILEQHGRLSPKDVLSVIRPLAESVALAHSQRIWVRELAPQNVLLTVDPSGRLAVTLANVGVAFKSLPSEYSAEVKKGYYSPEDRRDQLVDERSDVYALAALAYRMLEGEDPASREEGQSWSDLASILQPSLSADPSGRPSSVEMFLKTLTPLQSAKSSVPAVQWQKDIPRIITKRARMKVKRTDAEVIEQPSRRRGVLPVPAQTRDLMILGFFSGLFSTFLMWIGKKVEGLLASPKKLIAALVLVFAGILVALWFLVLSNERGDILVKVEVLAFKPAEELKKGVVVIIEAKDDKTGGYSTIRFSGDYVDSSSDGRVVMHTGRRGSAPVSYRGRFDPAQTKFIITARKDGELMPETQVKSLSGDVLLATFSLRPARAGIIAVTYSDAKKLLRPGTPAPESCSLELFAANAAGAPLKNAQFWFDNAPVPSIGPGKAQTQEQKYVLESKHTLRFQVEDSAALFITPRGSANPVLELESVPPKWRLTQSSTNLTATISIRKKASTERETFVFKIFDEDGSPVEGLALLLNNNEIGKTNDKGQVEFPVLDVEQFWAQKPVVKVDLHTFNTRWTMSKDYPLQRTGNDKEFTIRMKDIKPDN